MNKKVFIDGGLILLLNMQICKCHGCYHRERSKTQKTGNVCIVMLEFWLISDILGSFKENGSV